MEFLRFPIDLVGKLDLIDGCDEKMTWALCLNCGEVKFGAICPCPNCQVPSTGHISLDIAFSDHHLSKTTLEDLGRVIETIHEYSDDNELCFWTFIYYVSENHPSILKVNLPPEFASKVPKLLSTIKVPKITIKESAQRKLRKLNKEKRE